MNQELVNRLKTHEADNTELHNKTKAQEHMLDQFCQLHDRMAIGGGGNQSQQARRRIIPQDRYLCSLEFCHLILIRKICKILMLSLIIVFI